MTTATGSRTSCARASGSKACPSRSTSSRRSDSSRFWGAARKGGEREARRTVREVRTSAERDASCRERRQPPAEPGSARREQEASRSVRAVVVGAGSWGTAFACLLRDNGHEVTLAARDPDQVEAMARTGRNPRYAQEADPHGHRRRDDRRSSRLRRPTSWSSRCRAGCSARSWVHCRGQRRS